MKGNAKALKRHKLRSQRETRKEVKYALSRLIHGNPKIVPKESKITISSVAAEAQVSRSTLYNFHKPIVDEIQQINSQTSNERLKKKATELTKQKARIKEYRELAEQAQKEKEALARINYRLNHRINELEGLLRTKDKVIEDLKKMLNIKLNVVSLK